MYSLPRFAIALLAPVLMLSYLSAQQLQCNPCSQGYGPVPIGTSKQDAFQLKNTGTRTVHIASVSVSGSAFSLGNFPLPVTIRAGASTQLSIIFKPRVTDRADAKIVLASDADNPKLPIHVWGRGTTVNGVTLGASPTSLNFGNVTVGLSASLSLKLSATNGPVKISSVQSSSSEFKTPGLTLPLSIPAGQNVTMTVVFRPNASGTASENLALNSDATNSPTTVPLTGVGVAAGSHRTDLSWNSSQDPVIGYNVYRSTTKGGPYAKINSALDSSTSFSDTSVVAGATYYYVATAVDANDVESAHSNEVKAVIPTP